MGAYVGLQINCNFWRFEHASRLHLYVAVWVLASCVELYRGSCFYGLVGGVLLRSHAYERVGAAMVLLDVCGLSTAINFRPSRRSDNRWDVNEANTGAI